MMENTLLIGLSRQTVHIIRQNIIWFAFAVNALSRDESDLRTALRSGADDQEIADRWVIAMRGKLPGHGIDDPTFLQPDRPMSAIGG